MAFRYQIDMRDQVYLSMKGLLLKAKRNITQKCAYVMALMLIIGMTGGCGLREAVTGGFFGAISNIVSTAVMDLVGGLQ